MGPQRLQYFCLENPHGLRILAGYSPWGRQELDMTKHTHPETSRRRRRRRKLNRLEQETDICSCLSQAQASLFCSFRLPS